jgi:hypothetical protein
MIMRGLDANGDWNFGKGVNDYTTANAAIGELIQTRLNTFLGECFFATDKGLDWFNLLGTKSVVPLKLAVNAAILNTPGVTKIIDVQVLLQSSNRSVSVTYHVETIYTQLKSTDLVSGTTGFLLTESGDVITAEDGSPILGG